jgi:hypothetical protein
MPDIQGIELLVITKTEPNDKGNSRRLRLVQWVVDGQSKSVKLEKRNFFTDEYGEEKTGKADGFVLQDLEACRPHWKKIMELMKTPPPVAAPTAIDKAKEMFGAEEVPF